MIAIATILLVFYLILIGVQNSISDSWYTKFHYRLLYFLVLSSIGVMIVSTIHPISKTYLFHLSGLGSWLVAVSPNFKTKGLPKFLHFLGAGMIIVFGYLGICFEFGDWKYSLILILLSIFTYLFFEENKMYWFEVVAFCGLLGYLNFVI